MAEERDTNDDVNPKPLNYYAPDERVTKGARATATGLGVLAGLVVVLAGGAIPYMSNVIFGDYTPEDRIIAICTFAVISAGAFLGFIFARRNRHLGNAISFLAGLLIGAGVAALLEGACFAAS